MGAALTTMSAARQLLATTIAMKASQTASTWAVAARPRPRADSAKSDVEAWSAFCACTGGRSTKTRSSAPSSGACSFSPRGHDTRWHDLLFVEDPRQVTTRFDLPRLAEALFFA